MCEIDSEADTGVPEQSADDAVDPHDKLADEDTDDPDDLERFLREVPPHHGD